MQTKDADRQQLCQPEVRGIADVDLPAAAYPARTVELSWKVRTCPFLRQFDHSF